MDASPPRDYEMLHASSIAALQECGNSIRSNGPSFDGDTTVLLSILAGLTTARVLELSPTFVEELAAENSLMKTVPRIHAGNIACAIKTLLDLNSRRVGNGIRISLEVLEQARAIVALREYAESETNPQVMREMWLLQNALVAVGEYEEAQEVERDAFRRMESYIRDIPANSV
ncbi:Fc.00g025340.m01.CDS01 [Cosmosporella sp. VM-42]